MKRCLIVVCLVLIQFFTLAQNDPKILQALVSDENINIDGLLDEHIWQLADVADGFQQLEPDPGEAPTFDTQVKVLYDDDAIYIGALLLDESPEKILKQLSERDDIQNSDWFTCTIDTYKDGLNAFSFTLTAAGVQVDDKFAAGFNDSNWDAVWESDVKIVENGWSVEMKIPYSAIRFSNAEVQEWSIQFIREIRRFREQSTWNPIDPANSNTLAQAGRLHGIKNIKSPTRLSFTPFVVGYLNSNYNPEDGESQSSTAYSAGMDLKYGINDAFTLDMTLIPDFGQVLSDQQVLNLSPFEVFFEENRQFFTEGTDLFTKADIFYSRRVGSRPLNYFEVYSSLDSTETVIGNPDITSLYNATKISGRTQSGTGVGFFNAVAAEEYAVIENSTDGTQRQFKTNPLTNYNVLVVDQNLRNNSYVSLINTNVMRSGSDYDANVTGAEIFLKNKSQKYGLQGSTAISQKYFSDFTDVGHKLNLNFSKLIGQWKYGVGFNQESDNYDPNDLGFLFAPNERNFGISGSFTQFDPKSTKLARYSHNVSLGYSRLYKPDEFVDFGINYNSFFIFKSRLAFGFNARLEPIETYDFFEPRSFTFEDYYTFPTSWNVGGFVSTDYRKIFAIDINSNFRKFGADGRRNFNISVRPRLRLSDQWSLFFSCNFSKRFADEGYVNADNVPSSILDVGDEILFGNRDRQIITNTLSTNFIFTNNMFLNMRIRHYWDKVEYNNFGTLQADGYLSDVVFDGNNENGESIFNRNVNIFNLDLNYNWRFAPGSDINFNWKNQIFTSDDQYGEDYFHNFSGLFDANQTNSFSIKVIYFLDYLYLRR